MNTDFGTTPNILSPSQNLKIHSPILIGSFLYIFVGCRDPHLAFPRFKKKVRKHTIRNVFVLILSSEYNAVSLLFAIKRIQENIFHGAHTLEQNEKCSPVC